MKIIPHFTVYKAEETLVLLSPSNPLQQWALGCLPECCFAAGRNGEAVTFFVFPLFLKTVCEEVPTDRWHNGPNKAKRINKAKL